MSITSKRVVSSSNTVVAHGSSTTASSYRSDVVAVIGRYVDVIDCCCADAGNGLAIHQTSYCVSRWRNRRSTAIHPTHRDT